MDEFEFRQIAESQGIELPKDDSTTGYLRAMVVKAHIDQKMARERRNFFLKLLGGLVPLFTVGGIGYVKLTPEQPKAATSAEVTEKAKEVSDGVTFENTKRSLTNSAQIEKLGGVVVDMQQTQVESVDYIVKQIKAGRRTDVEKPRSLQDAETAVAVRKKKADAGVLLDLTPAEKANIATEAQAAARK
jgi:hypothetical protein